jgi:PAS domain S-box-containing protein
MDGILLVQTPHEISSRIRDGLAKARIEEIAAVDAITSALDGRVGCLGALVIGPRVASPVRAVERASAADPDLAVLILCQNGRQPRVLQDLRLSAFVGRDVCCVDLSHGEPLADLVRAALTRTAQRRSHQALLAEVESETEALRAPFNGFHDRLRETEEKFRAIFDQAAVGIAQIETQTGLFTRINRKYCEILGIAASDVKATTFMDVTHPDDLQADLDQMTRLEAGEIRSFSMEKRYIHLNGEVVWVNLTVSPLWAVGEEPNYHIAVVKDITAHKRAEEALRKSEEQLRLVVETVADPIVTIDDDRCIRSVNPAAEELFGYTASELLGRPMTVLMPNSLREVQMSALEQHFEEGAHHVWTKRARVEGRHRSGEEISLELSFGEFVAGGTRVFTGILHDIRERKREEERFRSAASELTQRNTSLMTLLDEASVEKRTLEKLVHLTADIESGLTLEEVLDHVFEAFQEVVPFDRIGCALVEDEGRTARSVWSRSISATGDIPVGYSASLAGSSLQPILESGRPRILNDLEAYLREHPDSDNTRRILAEGVRSSLTCPLIALGKPVGFLFFSSSRPHTYDGGHVELYLQIAEHLSTIIEKGRLYQELVTTKHEIEVRNQLLATVFGRYTSDAIATQLLESPRALQMGGETRQVTLLFADLRGFTRLCEMLDPQRVVRLLNIHLGRMTDVIMEYSGTIDEFLGDAILAIFGAPVVAPDDARRALACSLAMQRAMDGVNRDLENEGFPTLEMGIALHTGKVVAGNIGSDKRAKYGVVGSAVVLVTQMEKFTAGGQILCSNETLSEVGGNVDFDECTKIQVKGRHEPMQAFSVRGLHDQPELSLPPRSA